MLAQPTMGGQPVPPRKEIRTPAGRRTGYLMSASPILAGPRMVCRMSAGRRRVRFRTLALPIRADRWPEPPRSGRYQVAARGLSGRFARSAPQRWRRVQDWDVRRQVGTLAGFLPSDRLGPATAAIAPGARTGALPADRNVARLADQTAEPAPEDPIGALRVDVPAQPADPTEALRVDPTAALPAVPIGALPADVPAQPADPTAERGAVAERYRPIQCRKEPSSGRPVCAFVHPEHLPKPEIPEPPAIPVPRTGPAGRDFPTTEAAAPTATNPEPEARADAPHHAPEAAPTPEAAAPKPHHANPTTEAAAPTTTNPEPEARADAPHHAPEAAPTPEAAARSSSAVHVVAPVRCFGTGLEVDAAPAEGTAPGEASARL